MQTDKQQKTYNFIVHKGETIIYFCTSLEDAIRKRAVYIECLVYNHPELAELSPDYFYERYKITELQKPFTEEQVSFYQEHGKFI